jgi:hypothetical protein
VDLNTFITAVFCLADDWLRNKSRHAAAVRLPSCPTPRC